MRTSFERIDEVFPGSAFWREAFALQGAVTVRVIPRTLVFGVFAGLVALAHRHAPSFSIRADVIEGAGLVLGLLLVFRSAAGYARWWEARTLWGGIVNQSRNLVLAALAYGPADPTWRNEIARWTAIFAHVVRASLRGQRTLPETETILRGDEAARITASAHMPTYVSRRIASLLREARDSGRLDPFAFLEINRERASLLDHVGGCERILKTPIPKVYSITIRRFIVLYLGSLPFALAASVGLLSPAYIMLIAYPILSLEQIGAELQNPFVVRSLSYLDLDTLCRSIENEAEAAVASARSERLPSDVRPGEPIGTRGE